MISTNLKGEANVKFDETLNNDLKIIAAGIDSFAEDLTEQGVDVINVDWQPPASGNPELISLLQKLQNK